MIEWFESMAGPAYAPALMWTAIALLALFLILVAVKVFGRLSAGTFIAGGRNRRARLACARRHRNRWPEAPGAGAPRRCRASDSDRRRQRSGWLSATSGHLRKNTTVTPTMNTRNR